MNQRPTGVTILAILAFIGGAFGILAALALLGIGVALGGSAVGGLGFILGIVLLALSILYLWVGWGFWNLKRSAWSLGLVVFGAGILIAFIQFLLAGQNLTNLIVTIVINGVVIWYLLTPAVKAAFGVQGDLQSAVMSGLPGGTGAAAASAPPPAPPAAPTEPPASTWTPDSTGGTGSGGTDDSDRNA